FCNAVPAFSRTLFFAPQAQVRPKSTALARRRFDAYSSSHPFHTLANYGQAYACARILFRAMQALENPKDPLMKFRGNSNSVIFHPKPAVLSELLHADAHMGCQ